MTEVIYKFAHVCLADIRMNTFLFKTLKRKAHSYKRSNKKKYAEKERDRKKKGRQKYSHIQE